MTTEIRLTQFSHGAGCGCKIAPSVLEQFLKTDFIAPQDDNLLVGNSTKDDAAVYDLGDGSGIISTTDFFMPIVDDAFEFGRVAAANAISDIYAMGGTPIMAIAMIEHNIIGHISNPPALINSSTLSHSKFLLLIANSFRIICMVSPQ